MRRDQPARAREFFLRFQPRYRRVRWQVRPIIDVIYGGEQQRFERCDLYPLLRGEALRDGNLHYPAIFNLRHSTLRPSFKFNPFNKDTMLNQLIASVRDSIEKELKKARFYLDAEPGSWWDRESTYVQARYRFDGPYPRGLDLMEQFQVRDWKFFFPECPERDAIETALEIERGRKTYDSRMAAYYDELETKLKQHLKEAA
jgi:hypothetical protein